jgi:hypothetical protein
MWDGVCIEDAFFSAFIEENIQHAQAALAKVNTVKVQHLYPYKRALAAIAILRGDHAGALRLLQRGPSRSGNPFSRQRVLKMHAMVVSKAQRAVS